MILLGKVYLCELWIGSGCIFLYASVWSELRKEPPALQPHP